MTSTLRDFIVNELVYLLSVTDEAGPWTQRAKIVTKNRKKQEADLPWITHFIEHVCQETLELLISRSLV
jgi:hypothetical protein